MNIKRQKQIKAFLMEEFGTDRGNALFRSQEKTLYALIESERDKSRAQRKTLAQTILPCIALYKALLQDGSLREDALGYVQKYMLEKVAAEKHASTAKMEAVLVMLLPQEYKLAGAAVATAMSQVVGGLVPLIYFSRKNSSILCLGKTKYDGKAIWKACTNGSSEFMSNISMSLVGMLYNLQLIKYAGEDGVAAYGVMMYVSMIFAAVFIGYSIGTAPVIGFHDGAQNHDELHGLLRKSLIMIGLFGIGMPPYFDGLRGF